MKKLAMDSQHIIIGSDHYPLMRITDVWLHHLSFKCQIKRLTSIILQFSSVGCVSQMWVAGIPNGLSLLLPLALATVGLLYFIFSYRNFELRAQLTAVDETGCQVITLAKTRKSQDLVTIKEIEANWKERFV